MRFTCKVVEDIIKSLKEEPEMWKLDYTYKSSSGKPGIRKGDIICYEFGNTRLLSICTVSIGYNNIPIFGLFSRMRLENAYMKWLKNTPLDLIESGLK